MDRDEIARLLTEKGAVKPCHRCGAKNFTVLEGYSNIHLQENLNAGLVIGGPSVFILVTIGAAIWLFISIIRILYNWNESSLDNLIAMIKNTKSE